MTTPESHLENGFLNEETSKPSENEETLETGLFETHFLKKKIENINNQSKDNAPDPIYDMV